MAIDLMIKNSNLSLTFSTGVISKKVTRSVCSHPFAQFYKMNQLSHKFCFTVNRSKAKVKYFQCKHLLGCIKSQVTVYWPPNQMHYGIWANGLSATYQTTASGPGGGGGKGDTCIICGRPTHACHSTSKLDPISGPIIYIRPWICHIVYGIFRKFPIPLLYGKTCITNLTPCNTLKWTTCKYIENKIIMNR